MIARVAHDAEPGAAPSAVIPKLGERPCRIVPDVDVVEEGVLSAGIGWIRSLQVCGAEIGELAEVSLTARGHFAPHGARLSAGWPERPCPSRRAPRPCESGRG